MDLTRPLEPRKRRRLQQLVIAVAGSMVCLSLLIAALALFVVAGDPWGPCDPSRPDCGPSRGTFVGASFLCGILGIAILGVLLTWRRSHAGRKAGD